MQIQVTPLSGGVKATLRGFNTQEIKEKIESCQNGSCSCSCDPQVMEQITRIDLHESKNGLELTISGSVDAQTLSPMMQTCLTGDKK